MAPLGASANLHVHLSLISENELLLVGGENIFQQQAESGTFWPDVLKCIVFYLFIYLFSFFFFARARYFYISAGNFSGRCRSHCPLPALSEYGKDTTTLFLKYLVGLLLNLAPISLQQTFCIQTPLPLFFLKNSTVETLENEILAIRFVYIQIY